MVIMKATKPIDTNELISICGLLVIIVLSNFVLSDWSHLPWKVFNIPSLPLANPSFLVIEFVHFGLTAACFYHARCTNNLQLFLSAGVCGTANDIFFHILPICDNFWQAQATVMLTPRLPLYILSIYFGMIYSSATAARKLGLHPLGEAALTGLLCSLFYGAYDICGPKLLWWTWHDTDPAIAHRTMGAPNGSTCWILCYCTIHSLLAQWLAHRTSLGKFMQVLVTAVTCTPLFMMAMGVFQVLAFDTLGMPGPRTVCACVSALLAAVYHAYLCKRAGWRPSSWPCQTSSPAASPDSSPSRESPSKSAPIAGLGHDNILRVVVSLYFASLALVAMLAEPSAVTSLGIHQTQGAALRWISDWLSGPCSDMQLDMMGFERNRYLCATKFDEEFHFVNASSSGSALVDSQWYAIRGTEHASRERFLLAIMFFVVFGAHTFWGLLSMPIGLRTKMLKKQY